MPTALTITCCALPLMSLPQVAELCRKLAEATQR